MDWDEYFMMLVYDIAKKSKDVSTKVGCVVVGPDNEIRSTGYNSFPRGINDNVPERQERPLKYAFIEHSERAAFYNAARVGVSLKGCRIYLPWWPCADCARGVLGVGISEVIMDGRSSNPWLEPERQARWKDSVEISKQMFIEAGVRVRFWNDGGS